MHTSSTLARARRGGLCHASGLTALMPLLLLLTPCALAAQAWPEVPLQPLGLARLWDRADRALPGCDLFALRGQGTPLVCPAMWDAPRPTLSLTEDGPWRPLLSSVEVPYPQAGRAALLSVGVLAGAAANAFVASPHQRFHVTHEGFFGRDTYAGGGDKASHFVDYAIGAKELALIYE